MYLNRLICLSGMLLVSSIGCCHSQCVSSNPCDPCGQSCGGGGGCCLTNWLHNKIASCRMRCHNYSWSDDCSGGCPACGGGNCGISGSTMSGGGGGSGCGCGQSHGYTPSYAPSAPVPPTAVPSGELPAPVPVNGSAAPTRSSEPVPAPGATDSTSFQRPMNGQVQHVSVEEFHRLPGVVVSGPGQSSVPSMAAPTLAPPALSTVSVPPQAAPPVQQATWVPAR